MQCWCSNITLHPQTNQAISLNPMFLNAKRKRRRMLLWQSQFRFLCTAHIHRCGVGLMNTAGKEDLGVRCKLSHHACTKYTTPCHSYSRAPHPLHQAPAACPARTRRTSSPLLLLAESEPGAAQRWNTAPSSARSPHSQRREQQPCLTRGQEKSLERVKKKITNPND